jgi:hypothetical protein
MKLKIKSSTTSKKTRILVRDSSSTTGAGLTGLVYNSSGLVWYYFRDGDTAAASVPLANPPALGTFASGGFKEVDATNMPGVYEIGIPNAALTVAGSVHMMLKGATNMVPVAIEIELDALDYQDAQRGGMAALPATGTLAVNPTLNATQSFNNAGQTTKYAATIATGDIATDAITAAAITAAAVTKIQQGLSTLTQAQITGGAWPLATDSSGRVTVGSIIASVLADIANKVEDVIMD